MKSKTSYTIYSIFAGLIMAISSPTVNAASYIFSQGGFPDGGFVTGAFTGEDQYGGVGVNLPSNGPDGVIKSCFGRQCPFPALNEVTSFSIHFSGNSLFDNLNNIPRSFLTGLDYEISTNSLFVMYGTCLTGCPYWAYVSGPGWIIAPILGPEGALLQTTEPLIVSQIPLPGALGFFISGLAWLGIVRRKT